MAKIKDGNNKHTMRGANAGPGRPESQVAQTTSLKGVLDKAYKEQKWAEDGSAYVSGRGHNLHFYQPAAAGSPSVGDKGATVSFKAFLTDYEDSFTSNWNSEEVYGRMDPIQTFQGTIRNISLALDVVANGEGEALANLLKAERLIKMLYPMYEQGPNNSATVIGASPIIKLKYGNLISSVGAAASAGDLWANSDANVKDVGLVGTIDGLSYAPDIEAGFFDINDGGAVLPQTIKISFNFIVLHDHPLGWRPGKQNKEWDGFFLSANEASADVAMVDTSGLVVGNEDAPDKVVTDNQNIILGYK